MNTFAPALMTMTGAALVLAAASAGQAEEQRPPDAPVPVIVVRAATNCFTEAIRVTGFLVARQEAVVTLDIPGAKVTEVLAVEGDRVSVGQALARLTRQAPGTPGGGDTRTQAESITLKSPSNGTIVGSTATVGATASPLSTAPLFLIAVDDEIELEAEVPSVHVPSLASGQTAHIAVSGNRELIGRVRRVPAIIDQGRQLGRARISLERDPSLKLGMFVAATINAKRSCGVSVPSSAVYHRTEGTGVQVVRRNTIENRSVQVGLYSDTDAEIRSGLQEGEIVVANAGSSLRDGDVVRPDLSGEAQSERR